MRVIVFGSTGFVGKALLRCCHLYRIEVVVAQLEHRSDYKKPEKVLSLLGSLVGYKQQNFVINAIGSYSSDLREAVDTNVLVSKNISEACTRLNCNLVSLDTTKTGTDPYSQTKSMMRHNLIKVPGLAYINLRLHYIYGDGMPSHNFLNSLLDVIASANANKIIVPNEVRNFINVNDVGEAILATVNDFKLLRRSSHKFIVGSKEVYSFAQIAKAAVQVKKNYNPKILINNSFKQTTNTEIDELFSDLTGWSCRCSINSTLEELIRKRAVA